MPKNEKTQTSDECAQELVGAFPLVADPEQQRELVGMFNRDVHYNAKGPRGGAVRVLNAPVGWVFERGEGG